TKKSAKSNTISNKIKNFTNNTITSLNTKIMTVEEIKQNFQINPLIINNRQTTVDDQFPIVVDQSKVAIIQSIIVTSQPEIVINQSEIAINQSEIQSSNSTTKTLTFNVVPAYDINENYYLEDYLKWISGKIFVGPRLSEADKQLIINNLSRCCRNFATAGSKSYIIKESPNK